MTSPNVEIVSVSRTKISDEVGMNQVIITIKFDQQVTNYVARLNGVDYSTGIIVHSGGGANENEEVQVIIDWNESLSEGQNKINIYGQATDGTWTGESQTVIIYSTYGRRRYGTGRYGK